MAVFFTLCALSACTTATPEPQDAEPPIEIPEPEPEPVDTALVLSLLDLADAAMESNQLSSPVEGSAQQLYTEVLKLDPSNEYAARGLEQIVERYVELALRALERAQYASARSMIARARLIDPEHPSIRPTEEQIRLISQAKRTKLNLAKDLSDIELAEELAPLAVSPEGFNCRYVIWAMNDAEGRRIYQALRNGSDSSRLRAQILIRAPVGVERQCFPT